MDSYLPKPTDTSENPTVDVSHLNTHDVAACQDVKRKLTELKIQYDQAQSSLTELPPPLPQSDEASAETAASFDQAAYDQVLGAIDARIGVLKTYASNQTQYETAVTTLEGQLKSVVGVSKADGTMVEESLISKINSLNAKLQDVEKAGLAGHARLS